MHDLVGDVRSTVAYDKVTDRYYFTSKGGYFYSVRVEEKDGGYQLADLKGIKLENGSGGTAMSTSTPVVYNGRAYIGVSGTGQFTQYSGHNITVIDLESWSIAYRVTTQGYPQTSGMLTTAYDDGYAYVYFFDNYTPGKLRVLKDAPGRHRAAADDQGDPEGQCLFYRQGALYPQRQPGRVRHLLSHLRPIRQYLFQKRFRLPDVSQQYH